MVNGLKFCHDNYADFVTGILDEKNKTSYDALNCWVSYCDSQFDSGFAMSLALLYAI